MPDTDEGAQPSAEMTLAERLQALFERVPSREGSRKRMSNVAVAEGLNDLGISTTPAYVSQLRNGRKTNPSAALVGGLAKVFDVDVRYFYDDAFARELLRELDLLKVHKQIDDLGVTTSLPRAQGAASASALHDLDGDGLRDLKLLLDFIQHRQESKRSEGHHDSGDDGL